MKRFEEKRYVIISEDEKSIVVGHNQYRKLLLIETLDCTNIAIFKDESDALGVIHNQYIAFSQSIRLKTKAITIIYELSEE